MDTGNRVLIPIVSILLGILIGLAIGIVIVPWLSLRSAVSAGAQYLPPPDNYGMQFSPRAQTYTVAAYGAQRAKTDSYGDVPRPGTIWLIVDVELANMTDQPLDYNCLDLTLRDGVGYEYTSTPGPSPAIIVGNLLPGEKVRGSIAFEVLQDAKGFTLLYEDQRVPLK